MSGDWPLRRLRSGILARNFSKACDLCRHWFLGERLIGKYSLPSAKTLFQKELDSQSFLVGDIGVPQLIINFIKSSLCRSLYGSAVAFDDKELSQQAAEVSNEVSNKWRQGAEGSQSAAGHFWVPVVDNRLLKLKTREAVAEVANRRWRDGVLRRGSAGGISGLRVSVTACSFTKYEII